MTGVQLRARLLTWKISRRTVADALAEEGYHAADNSIAKWTTEVPPYAARLIERWTESPETRPGHQPKRRAP